MVTQSLLNTPGYNEFVSNNVVIVSSAISAHAALSKGVHGLNITAGQTLTSTGGTLGSAAYTASTSYQASGTYVTPTTLSNNSLPASVTTLTASGLASLQGAQIWKVGINDGAANYVVTATDFIIALSGASNTTVDMPNAATNTGRILIFRNQDNFNRTSNASNIVGMNGGAPVTTVVAGASGRFSIHQSDGTYWQTLLSN